MTIDYMADKLIAYWNSNDRSTNYFLISRNPYIFVYKLNGRTWHICDVKRCYDCIINNNNTDTYFEFIQGSKCDCGFKCEPKLASKLAIIRNIETLRLP